MRAANSGFRALEHYAIADALELIRKGAIAGRRFYPQRIGVHWRNNSAAVLINVIVQRLPHLRSVNRDILGWLRGPFAKRDFIFSRQHVFTPTVWIRLRRHCGPGGWCR